MSRSLRQAIVQELAATDHCAAGISVWSSFSRSEWKQVLAWLDLSGLALYYWHAVKARNTAQALPADVQAQLAQAFEENCARVSAIKREFMALNGLFENAGIEYVALKGLSLAPDYCPDPVLRTQYDHDYLVRPDSLRRIAEILGSAGYIRKETHEDHPVVFSPPVLEADPLARSPGLYSAGLKRSVEVHFRLWDPAEERIETGLPEDFLDRACRRSWQDSGYQALCDEDGLVFQLLHAFRHMLRNWCRLSIFLEIAEFLRSRSLDPDFWGRFRARVANLPRVQEASQTVFSLTERLFAAPFPPELAQGKQLKISPVFTLWIERYGQRTALANFRNNKSNLFLHREFINDRSAWGEIWRRRLFPMHRPHRLPDVLRAGRSQGMRKKWAGYLHAVRRFGFHGLSALHYAWEFPQWRLRRWVRLAALSQAGKDSCEDFVRRKAAFSLASEAGGRTRRNGFDG